MFLWEKTEFFWGFILLVLLIFVYIFQQRIRRKSLLRLGSPEVLFLLSNEASSYKPTIKFSLLTLALAFLVLTLANPLIGTKLAEGKRKGVDVVIILDVSNSMKAEDIKPNRLERAKQMIMKLIDKLVNDRIGIIVFAGEAYVQLPLTTDYSAAKLFTSYIDTDIVPTQGTAIGSAIELAVDKFNFEPNRKKAMIIITDGENHEDDAIAAAENAYRNNFVVHTIGMGTLTGSPIPIYRSGSREFLKDENGNVVTTRLDPLMLEKISAVGKGEFISNSGIDPDLSTILDKIAKMDKKEYETKIFTNFHSQYQYPLFVTILLLLLEIIISEKQNKFFANINSFFQKKKQ